jgi:hypothetical protein
MSQVRRQKREYMRGIQKSVKNAVHQKIMNRYYIMLEKFSKMDEQKLSELVQAIHKNELKGWSLTDKRALADANLANIKKRLQQHINESNITKDDKSEESKVEEVVSLSENSESNKSSNE